jgi:hypothetical protein
MSKDIDHQSAMHAIKTAEASLKLARQLLSGSKSEQRSGERALNSLPYVDGSFDGTHMVDASKKRYAISINYATKSMLVYGDRLRAYDDKGRYWFKQIERVLRERTTGILTKKSGIWHVATSDGSYKVSKDAIEFLGYEVNDEVGVILPAANKRVPFATLEFGQKKGAIKEKSAEPKIKKKEATKPVKKQVVKKTKPKKEEKEGKKAVSKTTKKKEKVEEKIVLEESDLR